jgi:hypothetical protein
MAVEDKYRPHHVLPAITWQMGSPDSPLLSLRFAEALQAPDIGRHDGLVDTADVRVGVFYGAPHPLPVAGTPPFRIV